MDIKVVCLIIFLTISNANSKPLPNEAIPEHVKQPLVKLHKLMKETWESSRKDRRDDKLFKRMCETHYGKTISDLLNSTLSEKVRNRNSPCEAIPEQVNQFVKKCCKLIEET